MIRKTILAAMLAASLGSAASSAIAKNVYARVAPPEPRVEVVPEPRRNRTWVAGHWEWQNKKYVWKKGSWVRDRPGYRYHQPAWAERDGRWHMTRGNWARGDRDGDGVRNKRDRAPNNPNRS